MSVSEIVKRHQLPCESYDVLNTKGIIKTPSYTDAADKASVAVLLQCTPFFSVQWPGFTEKCGVATKCCKNFRSYIKFD